MRPVPSATRCGCHWKEAAAGSRATGSVSTRHARNPELRQSSEPDSPNEPQLCVLRRTQHRGGQARRMHPCTAAVGVTVAIGTAVVKSSTWRQQEAGVNESANWRNTRKTTRQRFETVRPPRNPTLPLSPAFPAAQVALSRSHVAIVVAVQFRLRFDPTTTARSTPDLDPRANSPVSQHAQSRVDLAATTTTTKRRRRRRGDGMAAVRSQLRARRASRSAARSSESETQNRSRPGSGVARCADRCRRFRLRRIVHTPQLSSGSAARAAPETRAAPRSDLSRPLAQQADPRGDPARAQWIPPLARARTWNARNPPSRHPSQGRRRSSDAAPIVRATKHRRDQQGDFA